MNFEEANDIIERRYCYRLHDIPTVEEVEEAEKAFGLTSGRLPLNMVCAKRDICNMKGEYCICKFFTEARG